MPLKVKAICLPFVFVKTAFRQSRTLDVRRYQLVRLDRHYARMVWKHLRHGHAPKHGGVGEGDAFID